MVYETDRNCCKECGSICFPSGACTSCGWIPMALLADARADGKAEGIRETKESEFRLALQAITAAIREEREACAVLVEEHVVEDCYYDNSDSDARMTLSSAAAAIRARSGK